MEMKLRFSKQKSQRVKKRFIGFCAVDRTHYWFEELSQSWKQSNECVGPSSSHQDCNSVRAFRRKLKTAPKGVKFVLVSRWRGFDVDGTGTK
jgi:hypothetical protein